MPPERRWFWLAASAAAMAVALAGLAARDRPAPAAPAVSAVAADPAPGSAEAVAAERARTDTPRERLPRSLAGTQPDGALILDASGAFVPTPDAIDLFDYYLSAFGEEPLEAIVARIEEAIRARVDPPDAALRLLDRYLDYRDAVRRLVETEGLDALPLERRLQRLRETRRSIFGADVAEVLFAEDEERARNAIAWRRVANDPELDDDERAERIAALAAEWPEERQERFARITAAERVLARDAALRDEGASEAEIAAVRAAEFGEAAAARLAELDRARAAWNARVEGYRAERERSSVAASADAAEAAVEREALRARWFEGPELIRIRALDEFEERRAGVP